MMRKTASERLLEEQQKLEQQKNKVAALEKQAKSDERKKRTKRLIEVGALTTKYLANDEVLEPEKAQEMFHKICSLDAVKSIIANSIPASIIKTGNDEVFPLVRENESKQ